MEYPHFLLMLLLSFLHGVMFCSFTVKRTIFCEELRLVVVESTGFKKGLLFGFGLLCSNENLGLSEKLDVMYVEEVFFS